MDSRRLRNLQAQAPPDPLHLANLENRFINIEDHCSRNPIEEFPSG
jgi:hypothetical protein